MNLFDVIGNAQFVQNTTFGFGEKMIAQLNVFDIPLRTDLLISCIDHVLYLYF